jgi:hypothetical protein
MAANQLIQVQPALFVKLDQLRHVGAKAIGTHDRSLDAAFAQKFETMKFDPVPNGIMPTMVAVPPGRSMLKQSSAVCFAPTRR